METLALLPSGAGWERGPIEVMLRLGPPLGTYLLLCRVHNFPSPHLLCVWRYSVCCRQSNRAKLRFSLLGCVLGSTRCRSNILRGIYMYIEYRVYTVEFLYGHAVRMWGNHALNTYNATCSPN